MQEKCLIFIWLHLIFWLTVKAFSKPGNNHPSLATNDMINVVCEMSGTGRLASLVICIFSWTLRKSRDHSSVVEAKGEAFMDIKKVKKCIMSVVHLAHCSLWQHLSSVSVWGDHMRWLLSAVCSPPGSSASTVVAWNTSEGSYRICLGTHSPWIYPKALQICWDSPLSPVLTPWRVPAFLIPLTLRLLLFP